MPMVRGPERTLGPGPMPGAAQPGRVHTPRPPNPARRPRGDAMQGLLHDSLPCRPARVKRLVETRILILKRLFWTAPRARDAGLPTRRS